MKKWLLAITLVAMAFASACSGGVKGPAASGTSPGASTDASSKETSSTSAGNTDNPGTPAEATQTAGESTDEASPEIVMHVIKTILN